MIPAAFGDFNSDEYPDMFVIKPDFKTIEILLGGDTEPFIKKSTGPTCVFKEPVTSIVPGDYDGDAIMDVMVTLSKGSDDGACKGAELTEVRILWGSGDALQCNATFNKPLLMCGQPLAMDYNMDMIIDFFGVSTTKSSRTFWVFGKNRTFPDIHQMTAENTVNKPAKLRIPHSHAFLDLNGDCNPDMFVTTEKGYEVWLKDDKESEGFRYNSDTYQFPEGVTEPGLVGQSLFMDTELKGKLDHIVPICHTADCKTSYIYVRTNNQWVDLKINFHDKSNQVWGFVPPVKTSIIQNAITLHGGDYNMDGYPDLLATLRNTQGKLKTFLLMNEKCVAECTQYGRTFTIAWDELAPLNNNTTLGVFYDFGQDGILDVIFLNNNVMTAFKNNLDYDANFIKVMVITGLKDKKPRVIPTPTGSRKNRTFGTNLPGPLIFYNSTDQDDEPRASISPQLSQSAYMCLHLPYTLFGLGRTPNFVDKLTVGVYGKHHTWSQIIPNSQVVVIPIGEPDRWIAQLFVTPSKLIVKSFIALLGTCLLLALIIAVLWWKERREDHLERRQESHRFHYDAM